MKVAELIKRRSPFWKELEELSIQMGGRLSKVDPAYVSRFTTLYRAACADLALAESYQLPPQTVEYLHRLVGRAHNQLYRSQGYQFKGWAKRIFSDTPRLIFNDPCIQIATVLFWGLFLLAAYLSYHTTVWPGFSEAVVGVDGLDQLRGSYNQFGGNRGVGSGAFMMGYYIQNNATIGLQCFVMMLLVIPGIVVLSYNAIYLGAVFGFMFRPDSGAASENFQNFVTAHGPFELTAIILAAGAGLKIGLSWIMSDGLNRKDSLLKTARESLPIVMCAVVLFVLAAVIEGFVSPLGDFPWWGKGTVAVGSSCLLMIYFVVLGYPAAWPGGEEDGF
ncbi:stage II sporulation protein M [bacterium]|nr:stage II sporulation protein M [bacterium]MDB4379940.1 stage II sporulation protein M [Mariniblastus sp.]MDB4481194.1 stage II sporulation protein M [bacterium]